MNLMSEDQTRAYLEELRWPNGAQCPFCTLHQVTKLNGKRPGFYQCNRCRKQFTVRTGSIFERSHVPLSKWLQAVHLLCASKKGMSALQVSRMLEVSYKTAWFLCHRIREAMRSPGGLLTGTVEVDETYVGGKEKNAQRGRSTRKKTPLVAVIQRNGKVRTQVVRSVSAANLMRVLKENVDVESTLMTDDFMSYRHVDEVFYQHEAVVHSKKEYARGNVHVNNCESFFALLKRGLMGSFHHVSRKHLGRYSNEFAFRWDTRKITDAERVEAALRLAEGKRLMYCDLTNGETAKAQAN
ncbi:MAG: IS1595 family transposase [Candidatus Omnitrophica bacterium]|nr:IS1595 family transposase [Candidatus Omnitrophota bacterium]